MHRLARCDLAGQFCVWRRARLSRCRVRCLWRAAWPARAAFRAVSRRCQTLVDRDNVSFENDICKLANVTMTCRPIQQPHPPIWFAAKNDRAVRRAARLGDSWFVNPHATIPEITRQLTLYRAELTRLGKPFPKVLPYAREIYCAKDRATALEMAGPYLSEKYRTYANWGQDEVLPGNDSFRQPFEALLRDRFVLGSPEDCYEQLRPC